MNDSERIREALERTAEAMELKPAIGRATKSTTARSVDGLTCEVTDGATRFTVDMPRQAGGNAAGPDPGPYGRGALAGCMAIAYAMWFARLRVPVAGIEVTVEADLDYRGTFCESVQAIGYEEMRLKVHVASDASEADIRRVLEHAEAHSPWLSNFTRPIPVRRELKRVTLPAAAAAAR